MAIKVIIRHKFSKEKEKEFFNCIQEIRGLVPLQPGYISGEYLKTIDENNEIATLSTWFSIEDWHAWFESDTCKDILARIDKMGSVKTSCSIYRYIITR